MTKKLWKQQKKCKKCIESTKRVRSLWDGISLFGRRIHGCTYTCDNQSCSIATERRRQEKLDIQNRESVKRINEKEGIRVSFFRIAQRLSQTTLSELGKVFDLPVSTISSWETCRCPFPYFQYNHMLDYMTEKIKSDEQLMNRWRTVGVDFDGTLHDGEHFPEIGKPKQVIIDFVNFLHRCGSIIILYTSRMNGTDLAALDIAVEWCKEHNVMIDYVNYNPENEEFAKEHGQNMADCKKMYVDVYIDDKAVTPQSLESILKD